MNNINFSNIDIIQIYVNHNYWQSRQKMKSTAYFDGIKAIRIANYNSKDMIKS